MLESSRVLTPNEKPQRGNQEGCHGVEMTFWHMVTQGVGAQIFKELFKNPSIWALPGAAPPHAALTRWPLIKWLWRWEAGTPSRTASVHRGCCPWLERKPCLNLKSKGFALFCFGFCVYMCYHFHLGKQ